MLTNYIMYITTWSNCCSVYNLTVVSNREICQCSQVIVFYDRVIVMLWYMYMYIIFHYMYSWSVHNNGHCTLGNIFATLETFKTLSCISLSYTVKIKVKTTHAKNS